MSTRPSFSGKILPKVLRRAHNIPGLPRRACAWEADDIENTLTETCQALQEIQRQIQKGEETYFEETTSHANIFKGWDAFLDVRLEAPAAVTQVRRMPADYKWMSSSSVGIPQYYALPRVSLESALEKKRASQAKETSEVNAEETASQQEETTKPDGGTKSLKRKERSQEEQNDEEPTRTPRRPKRSKRS